MTLPGKRARSDHSDEEDTFKVPSTSSNSNLFAKFIIIQSQIKEKPITKLSPFVIEKSLAMIISSPKSVKYLNNGNLLVECANRKQTENLLKTTKFFEIPVQVFPHPTLNSSRGVVRCKYLANCESTSEILEGFASQGVTKVSQITLKRENIIKTNSFILTFNKPVLPKQVKAGNLVLDVSPYIPNPLRCFRCQRFGHHEDNCRSKSPICGRCAEYGHTHESCSEKVKCANCFDEHQTNSKSCPFWQKEKEILKIKYTENVQFIEARKLYEQRNQIAQQSRSEASYANVAKPASECAAGCKIIPMLIEKICALLPDKADEIRNLVKSETEKTVPIPPPSSSSVNIPPSSSSPVKTNPPKPPQKPSEVVDKHKSTPAKGNVKQTKNNDKKQPKDNVPPKQKHKSSQGKSPDQQWQDVRSPGKRNKSPAKPKLARLPEPVPTIQNKFELPDSETDMESESNTGSFGDCVESWNTPPDPPNSWENSRTEII